MTQRYASVTEVARFLGRTEAAIRNAIARGTIPFLRDECTGRISFDLHAIHAWMQKGRCDPEGSTVSHVKKEGDKGGESVPTR